jgi:hypothetical protein
VHLGQIKLFMSVIYGATTLSITTLGIKGLYVTLSISDSIQHNNVLLSCCVIMLSVAFYLLLAGATRPCPGHYIKLIKCTVRAKVARYVSPKVC